MNTSQPHTPPYADALRSLALTSPSSPVPTPGRSLWRWSIAAASIAATGIGLVVGTGHFSTPKSAPASAGAITVPAPGAPEADSLPSRPPPPREITGAGYVVAPVQTEVFSRSEGRVTDVLVESGEIVQAGQPLILLDDPATGFALEKAMAARTAAALTLTGAGITAAQAEVSLARMRALATGHMASRQQEEEAETTRDLARNAQEQAEQALRAAELAVRIAEENNAALTVRAPISGQVTRLNARRGDSVLARADSLREGQSLATLTDTAQLVIDADVAESGIAGLQPGLPGAAVLDAYPDAPFPVETQRIAPVVALATGTVALRLILRDPPPGIRPGMAARVRITPLTTLTTPTRTEALRHD